MHNKDYNIITYTKKKNLQTNTDCWQLFQHFLALWCSVFADGLVSVEFTDLLILFLYARAHSLTDVRVKYVDYVLKTNFKL